MEETRPQPSGNAHHHMRRGAEIILTLLAAGIMYAGNLIGIAAIIVAGIGVAMLASLMWEIFWGAV